MMMMMMMIWRRWWFTIDGAVRGEESFPGNWAVGDEVDDDAAAGADNVRRDATAAVSSNHLWAIDRLSVIDRYPVMRAPRMSLQVKLLEAVHRIAASISSGKVEKVLRSDRFVRLWANRITQTGVGRSLTMKLSTSTFRIRTNPDMIGSIPVSGSHFLSSYYVGVLLEHNVSHWSGSVLE